MDLGPRQEENKEQQLLLSCSLHELLIMNMELMEIDSLVSKQTAILIDLHFPFLSVFVRPALISPRTHRPACVSLH